MGDRIVVMKGGYVQQIDTPQALYETPCNKFVAGFLGSPQMNFIDAILIYRDGQYVVQFGSTDSKNSRGQRFEVILPQSKVTPDLEHYIDKDVILGIRPENVHDEPMYLANATTGIVKCNVEITELMGAETYLYLECEGVKITARVSPKSTARPQDEIDVVFDPEKIHLFDKETEKTIIN
jgi:multiple sugar transport system ATP-binding protein